MNNLVVLSKNLQLRKEIKRALSGVPVKIVAEANTVKETVEAMRLASTKMILVDMFLGDISGLDAIKSLKKVDDSLIIILISRLKNRLMVERAFRYSATDYLIYPFQEETLRSVVLHRLEQLDSETMISFQDQE
jgi:response regulator of citrate/malate metabolism